GTWLVWVCAVETKGVTWREIACTNIGQVSANEETAPLIGRRDRERCRGTAWAVQQIDGSVCGTPRARDIFPANREREAVFEGVTRQHRPTGRRCTLRHADLRVCGHVGVLKVGLEDPMTLCVCVDDVVNLAVVLYGRGVSLIGGLP